MVRSRPLALLALLSLLATTPAMAAATPRRVLVLTSQSAATPATFWESFVLAMEVQLGSYGVAVAQQRKPAKLPPRDLPTAARKLGQARNAIAVIWLEPAASAETMIHLHALDLTREGGEPRSLSMQRGPNIERSLALAARTLLQAPLAAPPPASGPVGAPSSRPATDGPTKGPVPPAPSEKAPLFFGADYVLELLPTAGELRHGPDVHATLRVWQKLEVHLMLGLRRQGDEETPTARVSRTTFELALGVGWRWALPHAFSLHTGLRSQAGWVLASADELATGQSADSTLWELAFGGETSLALRLGQRVRLRLLAGLLWIARGHEISLRGEELVSSGRLALRLGTGVSVGFW